MSPHASPRAAESRDPDGPRDPAAPATPLPWLAHRDQARRPDDHCSPRPRLRGGVAAGPTRRRRGPVRRPAPRSRGCPAALGRARPDQHAALGRAVLRRRRQGGRVAPSGGHRGHGPDRHPHRDDRQPQRHAAGSDPGDGRHRRPGGAGRVGDRAAVALDRAATGARTGQHADGTGRPPGSSGGWAATGCGAGSTA